MSRAAAPPADESHVAPELLDLFLHPRLERFASEAPIGRGPITTPSTVRNERNLCDHNVVIAW